MDFQLPAVGEGLVEVELVRWIATPGTHVSRGQALLEVMSDKATMEVPAAFEGTVLSTTVEPGEKIQVGQVVMQYAPAETAEDVSLLLPSTRPTVVRGELSGVTAGRPTATLPRPTLPGSQAIAAPSVRHLARKLNVDLATVRGTGPGGRILLDDLTTYLQPAHTNGTGPAAPKPAAPAFDLGKPGTRTKLLGLRRKIAEHMVASKKQIPHYAYIDECDLTALVVLRGQLKGPLARQGVKLTYLPFVLKAVARALKDVPVVNSTFDEAAQEVTLHDRYHLGLAVAAPNGLLVPVIRDVDKKDIPTLARDIERLSTEARTGKVKLDDLKGSTFTVTSIGSIGGLISTPIINAPEVGILGMGKVVKRPVYDEAMQLRPADMVYFSFSFDHRVLDGAIGATFGNALFKHLANPAALLLPD